MRKIWAYGFLRDRRASTVAATLPPSASMLNTHLLLRTVSPATCECLISDLSTPMRGTIYRDL